MKKSELTAFIKEEILSTLDEDKQTQQDIKDTEELTKAIDDLAKAKKEAGIEEDASDAVDYDDYVDIGRGYLDGFRRPHSLNDDQLEVLGRKVTKQLYKGDIDKAYQDLVLRTRLKEDEDKEPSDAEIKKNKSLAKAAEELAQLTKQMKSLARKYKEAEGEEKEKIVADLKKKTKLKKELEAIINK